MLPIRLFSYWPLWLLYPLAEACAFVSYHVLRYRKQVVVENLSITFPEKSDAEIRRIARDFYRNFCQTIVESVKAYRFNQNDWKKRVSLTNPEILTDYLDKDIPVIIMSGHTANWEWPAFAIGQQIGYSMEFLYKPVKNATFDRIMLALRTKHGGTAVPKDNAIREIIKRRRQPRLVGIIGDQLPAIGTEKLWFDFLNRETAFYVGAERIATMTQYAVFYVNTKRIALGRYEVTFQPIAAPPYEKGQSGIIESYVKLLEGTIHRNPSDYLWSHKRWKYTKSDAEAVKASS